MEFEFVYIKSFLIFMDCETIDSFCFQQKLLCSQFFVCVLGTI